MDLIGIAILFMLHYEREQIVGDELTTRRHVENKVWGIRANCESIEQVIVDVRSTRAWEEAQRRVDMQHDAKHGTYHELGIVDFQVLFVARHVVEKVAFDQNLDKFARRIAFAVLQEHGQTVNGRVRQLVVEFGIARVEYA